MKKKVEKIVSRETLQKYELYHNLILEWNRKTNLVQIDTLNDFWSRHLLDSLQLIFYLKKTHKILDVGSGAGFPGLVLAMENFGDITLCESNIKKTVFLEEVARKTNVSVKIICERVENINESYDVIISRACAKIEKLLSLTFKIVSRETFKFCLFLKGKSYEDEIKQAQEKWNFDYEIFESCTSSESGIVKLWNIKKRGN